MAFIGATLPDSLSWNRRHQHLIHNIHYLICGNGVRVCSASKYGTAIFVRQMADFRIKGIKKNGAT